MTDQEINEEIAKQLGLWYDPEDDGWVINDEMMLDGLPNYCNDLNAMHEAEKVFDANQASLYRKLLTGLTNIAYVGSTHPQLCYAEHATARQRAEAFLRTLNKWKD